MTLISSHAVDTTARQWGAANKKPCVIDLTFRSVYDTRNSPGKGKEALEHGLTVSHALPTLSPVTRAEEDEQCPGGHSVSPSWRAVHPACRESTAMTSGLGQLNVIELGGGVAAPMVGK